MEQFLAGLWEAAEKGGPFAALFALYAWWGERQERIKLQEQITALTKETTKGLTTAADSVDDLVQFLRSGRRKPP